jgi:hypothetical protein
MLKLPDRVDGRRRDLMLCWVADHLECLDQPVENTERIKEVPLEWDFLSNEEEDVEFTDSSFD